MERVDLGAPTLEKRLLVNRCLEVDRLIKKSLPAKFSRKPLSIVAVGGYGQKELCAGSDIDLLFLHHDLPEDLLSEAVERVTYALWDEHLDVGYRVCTIEEVLADASRDLSFLTALLSMRLVAGSRSLFQKMAHLFEERLISGRRKELFERLKKARERRVRRYGQEAFLLEPHLKEGLGGLRDYHLILWLARLLFGLKGLRDMERAGLLTKEERQALRKAVAFVLLVREELHLLAGRKEDRLYFEYQPTLAVKLGFGLDPEKATEKFMAKLYRAMTIIREETEALFDHVEMVFGRGEGERRELIPGLEVLSGRIHLSFREQALIDPTYLLKIFYYQAKTGYKLHHLTRTFLKEKWPLRASSGLEGRIFTKMLTEPHAYLALKSLRDTGLLLFVLPEFKRLLGLTQFDVYHVHPLDEHLFLTVHELHQLREEEPRFWEQVEDEEVLFLAGLLHDIAKGEGPGHAMRGAEKARDIARRLGLSAEQAEQVAKLVAQHLLLIETALRRDLTEEKVVADFAREVGDVGHLTRLYFLTVADSRATGPSAWNEWKAALVKELYLKSAKLLSEGELGAKNMKELVRREEVLKDRFGNLIETLPPCFLLHAPLEYLEEEIQLIKDFLEEEGLYRLQIRRLNGVYRVAIVTRDRPGLFADIAGAFAVHHLDIRTARIFTLSNGVVIDVFDIASPYGEIWWPEVEETIGKALHQEVDLEKLLRKTKPLVAPTLRILRETTVTVRVDNESSDFFTIVEVFAPDCVGLLYHLAKALTAFGLDIQRAFISNRVDLASDVFYVRTLEGEKLFEDEALKLKAYLEDTLMKFCQKETASPSSQKLH